MNEHLSKIDVERIHEMFRGLISKSREHIARYKKPIDDEESIKELVIYRDKYRQIVLKLIGLVIKTVVGYEECFHDLVQDVQLIDKNIDGMISILTDRLTKFTEEMEKYPDKKFTLAQDYIVNNEVLINAVFNDPALERHEIYRECREATEKLKQLLVSQEKVSS